jgi:hypothetical protein
VLSWRDVSAVIAPIAVAGIEPYNEFCAKLRPVRRESELSVLGMVPVRRLLERSKELS